MDWYVSATRAAARLDLIRGVAPSRLVRRSNGSGTAARAEVSGGQEPSRPRWPTGPGPHGHLGRCRRTGCGRCWCGQHHHVAAVLLAAARGRAAGTRATAGAGTRTRAARPVPPAATGTWLPPSAAPTSPLPDRHSQTAPEVAGQRRRVERVFAQGSTAASDRPSGQMTDVQAVAVRLAAAGSPTRVRHPVCARLAPETSAVPTGVRAASG